MTLCPVALAISCKKCPVVSFCPGKAIIGDFKPGEAAPSSADKTAASGDAEVKK